MKVLIFTEGGKERGLGHITRCLGLYRGFQEAGHEVFMVVDGDKSVEDLLKGINHQRADWLKHTPKTYAQLIGADIVIVDSYRAPLDFYRQVSRSVKKAVYLDDGKRLNYPKGTVLNGNIFAKKLNYHKAPGMKYLLGSRYLPLRRDFWRLKPRPVKKEVKKVFVTFGGKSYSRLTSQVAKSLRAQGLTVEYSSKRLCAGEILAKMRDCDLSICGGGQTINELASCGVPAVAVIVAENQWLNARAWAKAGFIRIAGANGDKGLVEKIKEIVSILDYKRRAAMRACGRRQVDGLGVRRVVEQVV
jgi:UDP-2,4-diacetamido-2,4,6-trideoxy-beta-L-altropyranose hydrolase